MTLQHLLALEMAFFLGGNSGPGRPAVLGIVVQAHRAHVNTSPVSEGTTVYVGPEFPPRKKAISRASKCWRVMRLYLLRSTSLKAANAGPFLGETEYQSRVGSNEAGLYHVYMYHTIIIYQS